MRWLVLALAGINLAAFAVMGVDKRRAVRRMWRIPEKILFLLPLLGGSAGGVLGMAVFHHKIRRPVFRYGFPLLLIVHLALFYCAVRFGWLELDLWGIRDGF